MEDTISREAAINTIFLILCMCNMKDPEDLKNMLLLAFQEMPSAQSEKETCKDCKWEYAFGYGECYHCKRSFEDMWEEKDNG